MIGGGDFANDRIIPDCIRAAQKREDIVVRNPYSTRPYQHVLEPLFAYLMIVAKQYEDGKPFCEYMIGSGNAKPLKEFIREMQQALAPDAVPLFGDVPFTGTNMPLETFSTADTEKDTGFKAQVSFAEGTRMTMDWLKTV